MAAYDFHRFLLTRPLNSVRLFLKVLSPRSLPRQAVGRGRVAKFVVG